MATKKKSSGTRKRTTRKRTDATESWAADLYLRDVVAEILIDLETQSRLMLARMPVEAVRDMPNGSQVPHIIHAMDAALMTRASIDELRALPDAELDRLMAAQNERLERWADVPRRGGGDWLRKLQAQRLATISAAGVKLSDGRRMIIFEPHKPGKTERAKLAKAVGLAGETATRKWGDGPDYTVADPRLRRGCPKPG